MDSGGGDGVAGSTHLRYQSESSTKLWACPGFLVLALSLALLGGSTPWRFAGRRSLSSRFRWCARCADRQTLPRLALPECVHERERTMYARRWDAQEDSVNSAHSGACCARSVLHRIKYARLMNPHRCCKVGMGESDHAKNTGHAFLGTTTEAEGISRPDVPLSTSNRWKVNTAKGART